VSRTDHAKGTPRKSQTRWARVLWWHRERRRTRSALRAEQPERLDGRHRHSELWDVQ
jgi:hypothetical protein